MSLDEDYEATLRYVTHIISTHDTSSTNYNFTHSIDEKLVQTLVFNYFRGDIHDETFVDKLTRVVPIENLKAMNFLERVKNAQKYIQGLKSL
jgi:hypothetical protein